ncbi:MAG: RHS repeat-associated core domain-containing protein [Spirochaetia bacterium]|nr:RHS repeat-associated core domain-containing protein [Spirochaetia bacterium]
MRVYSTDNGWGLFKDESGEARGQTHRYRRTYTWNSKNQLVSSVDSNYSTSYVYGQDGQRSNKYTQGSETLYFNKMWTLHTDNGNSVYDGQYAKNVYLGETRIVTKLARADQKTAHEEMYKQYYYHSDHLGSATMISDWEGKEYQRIEYTPYGETWVEKTSNSGSEFLPYRFTGKEVDQETGLYYYGARYLDPKYSMWISTDPALGEYIPEMDKGNAKDSGSLPGMGGVFNHINFHLYNYAGNNPVKFVDPDGNNPIDAFKIFFTPGNTMADVYRYEIRKEEIKFAQAYDFASEKVMEGAKFISENGCLFSLTFTATGQVELAFCVDAITVICDITVAFDKYDKSNHTDKDKALLTSDLVTTVLSTIVAGGASKTAAKRFAALGKEDFVKRLSDSIGSFIGNQFDRIVDDITEEVIIQD